MQGIEISTDNGKIKISNLYITPSITVTKDDLTMLFPDHWTLECSRQVLEMHFEQQQSSRS